MTVYGLLQPQLSENVNIDLLLHVDISISILGLAFEVISNVHVEYFVFASPPVLMFLVQI